MTHVTISSKLGEDTPLWRYMSLDKLVDLLAEQELHFTPLATFAKSDPFEGYLPAVAMDADASIVQPIVKDAESAWQLVEEHRKSVGHALMEEERTLAEKQIVGLKRGSAHFSRGYSEVDCRQLLAHQQG